MLSNFISKLIYAREVLIKEGRVEILGEREAIIPVSALSKIQDLNPKGVYEIVKQSFKNEIDIFSSKTNMNKTELISLLKDIFETTGLGSFEVVKADILNSTAVIRVYDNPIALYHAVEKKKNPCMIIAGILAGIYSSIFEKDVDAEEKSCLLNKSNYCEFLIK